MNIILILIFYIICVVCSTLIALAYDEKENEGIVLLNMFAGPLALIYFSIVLYKNRKDRKYCEICSRWHYGKIRACRRCRKKYNIENKADLKYVLEKLKLEEEYADLVSQVKINVLREVYAQKKGEFDAENKTEVLVGKKREHY